MDANELIESLKSLKESVVRQKLNLIGIDIDGGKTVGSIFIGNAEVGNILKIVDFNSILDSFSYKNEITLLMPANYLEQIVSPDRLCEIFSVNWLYMIIINRACKSDYSLQTLGYNIVKENGMSQAPLKKGVYLLLNCVGY